MERSIAAFFFAKNASRLPAIPVDHGSKPPLGNHVLKKSPRLNDSSRATAQEWQPTDAKRSGRMETLSRLIDRRPSVAPATSCEDVLALFSADPNAFAVAVSDQGAPMGVVYRDVLIGMMQVAADTLSRQPISQVMDVTPRVVPMTLDSDSFVDTLAERTTPVFRSAFIAVDDNGLYVGVGGLGSLIASHRRRDLEARDATALVDRLATDISHYLDGVLAIAARLEQQPLSADASAFVRAISETSRDMSEMLGRARDLQRSTHGQLTMRPSPVRLRDLADAVEVAWSQKAASGGSTLMFSYDGDPECTVDADAERLLQVFDALIDSALASGRGVIEACLHARPCAGGVALEGSVRDNTQGPAESRLARIFSPLGAAHLDDRSDLVLGVGMALAHRIMRDVGGELTAVANRGAGLTVRFSLVAPLAQQGEAAGGERLVDTRAAHILIVDDNATNRMVAEALCDLFDCTSEQAVDGVEAVDLARSGRFDLILMDIKMPRMDGIEATRAIRTLPGRVSGIPIVALTANAGANDVQAYKAAGMQDVVEKPIKPERLAMVLSALLGEDEDAAAA